MIVYDNIPPVRIFSISTHTIFLSCSMSIMSTQKIKIPQMQIMTQLLKKTDYADDYADDKKLIEYFRILDKDGNGFISPSELRHVLDSDYKNLDSVDEVEFQDFLDVISYDVDQNISNLEKSEYIVADADNDGDGQMNYEELVQYYFQNV